METSEHHYFDNPENGHPDVKTSLKDVEYFFIGNSHIETAVQYCPHGDGTILGLLIMNPNKFGTKRNSLSLEHETGISKTQLFIDINKEVFNPVAGKVNIYWTEFEKVPAVEAKWSINEIELTENFYCPDRERAAFIRKINIVNKNSALMNLSITTGVKSKDLLYKTELDSKEKITFYIEYTIDQINEEVNLKLVQKEYAVISNEAKKFWQNTASADFGNQKLNNLLNFSKYHIQANTSSSGRMDASIWQYNLEWVRDQSNTVMGMIVAGQFEVAKTILKRMLEQFVTNDGDTVDSSRVRAHSETELDQNGELLLALKMYVDWTGDFNLIEKYWTKIKAVADFPLKDSFKHHSGLLHNQRDLWERHSEFGIEDGMEMAYQLYVSIGLKCAAYFAEKMNDNANAVKWKSASEKIKTAMLSDKDFSLIDNGHLIKRRKINGDIQWDVFPRASLQLTEQVPLGRKIPHLLNPDCSYSFPISLEFIDPKSSLALKTMLETDKLFNMNWNTGGHSRYNISSEPDSPGPWPLASALIAQGWFQIGDDDKVWDALNWLFEVPGCKSGGWFEFYGPRPIPPCPQIGIIPWTWGEIMKLLIHHLLGIRPEGDKLILKSRLLKGLEKITAKIRIRNFMLNIEIKKSGTNEKFIILDNKKIQYFDDSAVIDMPTKDIAVTLLVQLEKSWF